MIPRKIISVLILLGPALTWAYLEPHSSLWGRRLSSRARKHPLLPHPLRQDIWAGWSPSRPCNEQDARCRNVVMLSALPSLPSVAACCLLPTSLGFIKSEYGVSYGYGTSVALTASLVLQSGLHPWSLAFWHTLALVFYGVRLDIFLLYRETCLSRFRDLRERIESKAPPRRNRAPFIVSCALLYGCMAAPLWATAPLAVPPGSGIVPRRILPALVATTWFGFLLAAVGDTHKSIAKARRGDDALVSGGVFRIFRHPNYTGEMIGWTASFLAALLAGNFKENLGVLLCSFFGWLGIVSILAMTATRLEENQREKYGNDPTYQDWIKRSWAGITLKKKEGISEETI